MQRTALVTWLGIVLLTAFPAMAQDDDAQRRDAEERLEQAQHRLEEAAREIAELTAGLGGNFTAAMGDLGGMDFGGRRAMLGINIADPAGEREDGVEVTGVSPGGPAGKAGIETGDVLLSLNGESLERQGDQVPAGKLLELMRDVEPGTEVTVEYERDGKTRSAGIQTEEIGPRAFAFNMDDDQFRFEIPHLPWLAHFAGPFYSQWGSMELTELTPGLGSYFGTDQGLLVVHAPEDASLMLRDGDVILGIAGRKPESPTHAMRILRSYRPGEDLSIDIVRQQKKQTLEFRMPDAEAGAEEARFRFGPPAVLRRAPVES